MRRRDFIKGIVSAGAWPLAARAQQETQTIPIVIATVGRHHCGITSRNKLPALWCATTTGRRFAYVYFEGEPSAAKPVATRLDPSVPSAVGSRSNDNRLHKYRRLADYRERRMSSGLGQKRTEPSPHDSEAHCNAPAIPHLEPFKRSSIERDMMRSRGSCLVGCPRGRFQL
jgi:hypothetical protein